MAVEKEVSSRRAWTVLNDLGIFNRARTGAVPIMSRGTIQSRLKSLTQELETVNEGDLEKEIENVQDADLDEALGGANFSWVVDTVCDIIMEDGMHEYVVSSGAEDDVDM